MSLWRSCVICFVTAAGRCILLSLLDEHKSFHGIIDLNLKNDGVLAFIYTDRWETRREQIRDDEMREVELDTRHREQNRN